MSFNRDNNTYHVSRAGKEIFRLDASSLLKHWQAGQVEPTDHYWYTGMSSWLPMSGLPLVMGVPRFGQRTAASSLPSSEPSPPPASRQPSAPYPSPYPAPAATPAPRPSPAPSPSPFPAPTPSSYPTQNPAATQPAQNPVPVSRLPPPPGHPPDRCPSCNSKSIKTARAIYLAGTRDSTSSGTSYGWGRRSSPRSWNSTRTSHTRLASQMIPPDEMGMGCGLSGTLLLFILVPLGLMIMLGGGVTASHGKGEGVVMLLAGAALIGYFFYRSKSANSGAQSQQQEMAARMEEYERTWYCSKCASKFIW